MVTTDGIKDSAWQRAEASAAPSDACERISLCLRRIFGIYALDVPAMVQTLLVPCGNAESSRLERIKPHTAFPQVRGFKFMVAGKGIEPLTRGFSVPCSTN